MKQKEFINEVKNSNVCPSNFDEKYKKFNFYQEKAYETLLEFHRVCERNDILYEVAFGSLLGLIRDGKQIPWDYDIDVIVPFCYKEKLIDALKRDLDDKYYFYCHEIDDNCRNLIMRLAPKGFNTDTLHVDVFYFVGAPDELKEREKYAKRIKRIAEIRYIKKLKVFQASFGSIRLIIIFLLKKIKYCFENINNLMKDYSDLCSKYDVFNSKVDICADKFALTNQYESKYLWETTLIKDEDGNDLRIPKNYETILTKQYGDYHKIFPLEERLKEMLKHLDHLEAQNGKVRKDLQND